MRQAETIDEVIQWMEEIDAEVPPSDGVGYFNRLYLQTTLEIQHRRIAAGFEDSGFLERLDVDFANMYFAAHLASEQHREPPSGWAALFHARSRPGTLPIQFALAGMNVHVNHDLPIAVVRACQAMDRIPAEDTPAYRDFQRTNDILQDVNLRVRQWFESGAVATMDAACGRLDDAMEMWCLADLRRLAWRHAELLWRLRGHADLQRAFLESLTAMVDVATKGLLI